MSFLNDLVHESFLEIISLINTVILQVWVRF